MASACWLTNRSFVFMDSDPEWGPSASVSEFRIAVTAEIGDLRNYKAFTMSTRTPLLITALTNIQ